MRLRNLMLNDEATIRAMLAINVPNVAASGLDDKTHALVGLAALLAINAASASYVGIIGAALAAGATDEEVIGTLIAVAPTIGTARVVAAAPEVAVALGYEVDEALERSAS